MARLTDAFTCVRLDPRGHGASSAAADFGVPEMAGDVQAAHVAPSRTAAKPGHLVPSARRPFAQAARQGMLHP